MNAMIELYRKSVVLAIISFFIASAMFAQQGKQDKITLTGIVKTSSDQPVEGAYLFIDGTQTNVRTNKKGSYKIKIGSETKMLSVYSESDGSEETAYSGQDRIDFVLSGSYDADISVPPKEFVNIGYGEVEKDKVTSSIGTVDNNNSRRTYSNIYSMIQAEVPGVIVTGERVIIRGIHTNSDNSDPLFVVNGAVVSSISYINPMEVESIDILKGPAASIYGINAANGVILINLKK